MANKFCVSISHAKDNTDKATVGFVVANAAAGSGKETLVFLSVEGVRLAQKGYANDMHEEGFAPLRLAPEELMKMATQRGLEVQFELGRKHGGPMTPAEADALVAQGRAWLEVGATTVVIEARESAESVGLFDARGALDGALADRFAAAFSLEKVVFEAPTKGSQFALINHFGPQVRLGNVRLEELLRVEIYRRGLHSDAFGLDKLRPGPPPEDRAPH